MRSISVKRIVGLGLLVLSAQTASGQWVQTNGPGRNRVNALAVQGLDILAGTSVGMFRSSNNGSNWVSVSSGLTDSNVTALLSSGEMLFAGTTARRVFSSVNNGTSWIAADSGLQYHAGCMETGGEPIRSIVKSGATLYAGTFDRCFSSGGGASIGAVFSSEDGGRGWSESLANLYCTMLTLETYGNTVLAVAANQGQHGWWNSRAYLTADSGLSWTMVDSLSVSIISLAVVDSTFFAGTASGWTSTDSSSVLISKGSGTNWVSADSGLPGSTSAYSFAVNSGDLFVGTSRGIFFSSDKGRSWKPFNTGLPDNVGARSLAISGDYLFAGTDSNGVWRRPLSQTGAIRHGSQGRVTGSANLTIHPPSHGNSVAMIEFSLSQADHVTVKIHNLSGRETSSLVNRDLSPGTHRFLWDTRNVAPGCYAVRMQKGTKSWQRSVMVSR